jgi:mono/diheme cytochrome c family protein
MVNRGGQRLKVPFWAVPVLVALPVWAWVYVGTLSPTGPSTSETIGAEVYASHCSACHGSDGQGGNGPGFAGGAVFDTWPSFEDHLEWVKLGGAAWIDRHGPTYGTTARTVNGAAMPGFGDRLTNHELLHVVQYERTVLAGTNPDPADDARLREATRAIDGDASITLDEAIAAAAE